MRVRQLLVILGFACVAMLGYWLAGTAVPRKSAREAARTVANAPRRTVVENEALPKFRRAERPPSQRGDFEAAQAGALEGQRVLVFKDQSALLRFLERAGDRIRLLGRLDALNALRVGFAEYGDLRPCWMAGRRSRSFFR